MRAVVQRVTSAAVTVDNQVISSISQGLMVLVGLGVDDKPSDIEQVVKKLLTIRLFPDANDAQWKLNIKDIKGEILCVSQFTLYADLKKGNKPDFHGAMPPLSARDMYASFLNRLGDMYDPSRIKDGQFGAMMSVQLTNDGPVTVIIDSEPTRSTQQYNSADANHKSAINAERLRLKEERKALWTSKKGPAASLDQASVSTEQ